MRRLKPRDNQVPVDVKNREDAHYMKNNIMPLLKSLNEEEKLPCIMFM